jgi:hypothetical protein
MQCVSTRFRGHFGTFKDTLLVVIATSLFPGRDFMILSLLHRSWEIASHTTSTSSTGVSERERKQPGKSGIEEIAGLLYWCNVHIERQLRFESGRPKFACGRENKHSAHLMRKQKFLKILLTRH